MEFVITSEILVLLLGALASIGIVTSAFSMSRINVLWATVSISVFTGIQFAILNQFSTVFLIAVTLIYSLLLVLENRLPFVRTHAFTAFILAVSTVGYVLINGLALNWGLLAFAGTIIGTVALWVQNPITLKITMLAVGFIWLAYQLVSGAYGQIPGELVFIVGSVFSIIMLIRAQKNGVPLSEVEELPTIIRRKLASRKTSSKVVVQSV